MSSCGLEPHLHRIHFVVYDSTLITPAMTPYIYIRHRRRVAASSRVGASYITPRICSDRMLLLLTSLIEVHLLGCSLLTGHRLTNRSRCRCTCCSRSCTRRRRATTPACSTAAAAPHTKPCGTSTAAAAAWPLPRRRRTECARARYLCSALWAVCGHAAELCM